MEETRNSASVKRAPRSRLSWPLFAAICGIAALVNLRGLQAAYEAPNNSAYDSPTSYYSTALNGYSTATNQGFQLRSNLHSIISANFTMRSYGDTRYAMGSGGTGFPAGATAGKIDVDPSTGLLRLVYNGASIAAGWDNGGTWNREHVWPKHWLNLTSDDVGNTYKGPASDLFEVWPSNPTVNSTRGDDGYGLYPATTGAAGSYGVNGAYWFPGTYDAGELSRSIFYMATRYFTASNPSRGTDIQNLEIVNGTPSLYNMGDLTSLLHWNYEYGVDNFERRRNALIYGKSFGSSTNDLNPSYFQGNRNPYIDHPEYVWAVYGTHVVSGNIVNNSQISVGGGGPASDGSSSATVNLNSVIVGGTISGSGNVAFNKTGADPTTFDITAANGATIVSGSVGSFSHPTVGTGQGIDFGNQSGTITVGLSASTATAGLKSGTLTVHNSDLTTAGTGQGSADTNDTVTVSASVLDHSNGSFSAASDSNSLTINLGRIGQNSGLHQTAFNINNLMATVGYTAGLNLTGIAGSGDTSQLTTNLATFTNLAAGSAAGFLASFNTSALGTFSATYSLSLSDVALSGATANAPLALTLLAIVNPFAPGDFNLDHHVNAADIAPMLLALTNVSDYELQYGATPTDLTYVGDVNGDGVMNNADLQALETNLIAGQGTNSSVPEPSSLLLLGLGSLFLTGRFCARRGR